MLTDIQIKEYINNYRNSYTREQIIAQLTKYGVNEEKANKIFDETDISKLQPPKNTTHENHFGMVLGIVIGVMFFGLLLFGIVHFSKDISIFEKDSVEYFQSYLGKLNNVQEYSAAYKAEVELMGLNLNVNIGEFIKGDKSKTSLEMSFLGVNQVTETYTIGNETYSCTTSINTEGIECREQKKSDAEEFENLFNFYNNENFSKIIENKQINISYLGKEEYIERSCDMFEIIYDNVSEIINIGNDFNSQYDSSKSKIYICFDEKTGIISYGNMSYASESNLLDDIDYEPFFTFEIKKLSETVDESELELPIKFLILETECSMYEGIVVGKIFKDFSGNPIINFYEKSYLNDDKEILRTEKLDNIQINKLEYLKQEFRIPENLDGTNLYFELCYGDDCVESSCYHSTYSFEHSKQFLCMQNSLDENSCNLDDECYYANPVCEEFSCSNFENENECNSIPECEWNSWYCSDEDYENSLTGIIESSYGNLLAVNRLENGTIYIKNTGSSTEYVSEIYIRDSQGNFLCTPMKTPFEIESYSLSTTKIEGCGTNLTRGNTYTVLIFTESGDIYDPVAILR